GFELPGPWGVELLNADSDARGAGPRLLLTAASYRLNPDYALLAASSPADALLRRWDQLLAARDAPGLAGADAHSRLAVTKRLSLRFPSYEAIFRQARNHVLLERPLAGDAARDRLAVLEALRRGRVGLLVHGAGRLRPALRYGGHGRAGRGPPRDGRRAHAGRDTPRPAARRLEACRSGVLARRGASGRGRLPGRGLRSRLADPVGAHEPDLRLRRRDT